MRTVVLPDGTRCSALGFGCGAVMGRIGRRESLRAMQAAFNEGVTLFDVARSYGYGEAEGVLGEFLQGRRDRVLVSTKFGVEPSPRQRWKAALRPVARALLRVVPGARQAVRRQAAGQIRAAALTPAALNAALATSLRALRTDYVDFLFLHDVGEDSLRHDDLLAALAGLHQQGKVRSYGVSSSLAVARHAAQSSLSMTAVQMPVNLPNLNEALRVGKLVKSQSGLTLLANHLYGGVDGLGAARSRVGALLVDKSLPVEVRDKLRACGDAALSSVVVSLALHQVGAHAAVVSMMHPQTLAANLQAVRNNPWTDAELRTLVGALTYTEAPARRPNL